MNSDQISAFIAAAGADPGKVKLLSVSLLAAFAFLWVAYVVRNLGMETLHGRMKGKKFAIYTVRAVVLVMIVVALIS